MRELLRQMAGESYVELEPNRPARVTGKCYQSLRDFFLFAPIVYVASPPLAADRRTEEELAQLRDIQPDFRAAIAAADVEARVFLNDPFHLMIGEVAQNAYVRPGLRRCLIDHARIAKVFYEDQLSARNPKMRVERDEAADQHDQIIAAIEARDPDRAESIVRAHLYLSRRNIAMYATPEAMTLRFDN